MSCASRLEPPTPSSDASSTRPNTGGRGGVVMEIHRRLQEGKTVGEPALPPSPAKKAAAPRGDRAGAERAPGGAGSHHRFRARHTAAHEGAPAPHWWSMNDTRNSTGIAPSPSNTSTQPSPRSQRSRRSFRFVIVSPATRGPGQLTRSAGPPSLPPWLGSAGAHARLRSLEKRLDRRPQQPSRRHLVLSATASASRITSAEGATLMQRSYAAGEGFRSSPCCLCRHPINGAQ